MPVYDGAFAADPDRFYREARQQFGSLVPVKLAPGMPATVVVGYGTALEILRNPDQFPADPRAWQQAAPSDLSCPVRSNLEYRPTPPRTSHSEHARLRRVHVEALDHVDLHALQVAVERCAVPLINSFCGRGEADLRGEFALPLAFEVVNQLCGVTGELAVRLARGWSSVWEAAHVNAAAAGYQLVAAVLPEVVEQKKTAPGEDITSWLIGDPAELSDEELTQQVALIYEMGIEPIVSLVLNTLRLMLTDDRLSGHLLGGALSTRDALDEVLFTDPPVAAACVTYPRVPVLVDGSWLPANQPVVISLTACNRDPAVRGRDEHGNASGLRAGNRSHLAWGAGEHACPAADLALIVATGAIDQLMDVMPDLRLAVPAEHLTWRPSPFHRAMTSLPVVFPPTPPLPLQH
ncbi:cytochrome P450 [Nocardia rhamnosiphila]